MHSFLEIHEIVAVFREEIDCANGTIADHVLSSNHLFIRAHLPQMQTVRPHDEVQAGVALRADDTMITVLPYVYRLICTNGTLHARPLATHHIGRTEGLIAVETAALVCEAVQACGSPQAFQTSLDEFQTALAAPDAPSLLRPHFGHRALIRHQSRLSAVLEEYAREGERTWYGLMNAVSAVARDTADPAWRWHLQVAAGEIVRQHSVTPLLDLLSTEAGLSYAPSYDRTM